MNIFKLFEKIKTNDNHSKIEKIVVGLGNPTPKYENTRHNAGFLAIDYILNSDIVKINKENIRKFQAVITDLYIKNVRCLFLKPITYMNNSGEAVEAVLNYYKLNIKDLLVIYDDISFDVGEMKIKKKGSAGGHNGIKSIIYDTGEENFVRIKIGVGKKPHKDYDLAKWVLSTFTETEKENLNLAFEKAKKATELIVSGEVEKAMNEFN